MAVQQRRRLPGEKQARTCVTNLPYSLAGFSAHTSSDFFLPRASSRYLQKKVSAHLLAVVDSFASCPSESSGACQKDAVDARARSAVEMLVVSLSRVLSFF